MPRHKTPLGLKARCVTSIARNMDLWCADFVVRGSNVDSHRHRVVDNGGGGGGGGSPLEFLPSDLVVDIIKALWAEKRLKRRYLESLLHERVHQLDLSLCNKTISIDDSLFMTVGFRLTSLRSLCLDMCKSVTPECLVDILSRLAHLQTLSANWSLADNQVVVAAVARRCKALRELSLQGCCGVSDVSVDAIVGTDDGAVGGGERGGGDENENVVVGDDGGVDEVIDTRGVGFVPFRPSASLALPHLTSLNVTATRVSTRGVRKILKHLTELRHLYHEDGVLALYLNDATSNCRSSSSSSSSPPSSSSSSATRFVHPAMKSLTQTGLILYKTANRWRRNRSLSVVFDSCRANSFVESFPHLNSLVLHTRLCDKAVLCLSGLSCLQSLDIYDSSHSLTFGGGILPLLAARSKSLSELTLNELDEIDLMAVVVACSESLTSLFCLGITSFSESYSSVCVAGETEKRSCLKRLRVLPFGENNLTSSSLKRLLRICHRISTIHFNNIQVIDDSLLSWVLLSNPLDSLSEACFTDCNAINADFLLSLLNRESDLSHLKLVDCEGVGPDDFHDLAHCIVENNYNTCLEIQRANLFSLIHPPR